MTRSEPRWKERICGFRSTPATELPVEEGDLQAEPDEGGGHLEVPCDPAHRSSAFDHLLERGIRDQRCGAAAIRGAFDLWIVAAPSILILINPNFRRGMPEAQVKKLLHQRRARPRHWVRIVIEHEDTSIVERDSHARPRTGSYPSEVVDVFLRDQQLAVREDCHVRQQREGGFMRQRGVQGAPESAPQIETVPLVPPLLGVRREQSLTAPAFSMCGI